MERGDSAPAPEAFERQGTEKMGEETEADDGESKRIEREDPPRRLATEEELRDVENAPNGLEADDDESKRIEREDPPRRLATEEELRDVENAPNGLEADDDESKRIEREDPPRRLTTEEELRDVENAPNGLEADDDESKRIEREDGGPEEEPDVDKAPNRLEADDGESKRIEREDPPRRPATEEELRGAENAPNRLEADDGESKRIEREDLPRRPATEEGLRGAENAQEHLEAADGESKRIERGVEPAPVSEAFQRLRSAGARAEKCFVDLSPDLLLRISRFLVLRDVGRLQCTTSRRRPPVQTVDWEQLFQDRNSASQRAGALVGSAYDAALRAQGLTWKLAEKQKRRQRRTHDLRCMSCRKYPIDGPLYSCLYCYGEHWVLCSDCEATAHSWHPKEHILIRWPKAYPRTETYAGRFKYKLSESGGPLRCVAHPGVNGFETCTECLAEERSFVVKCLDCAGPGGAGHPILCLRCGVGSAAGVAACLREPSAGRRAENARVAQVLLSSFLGRDSQPLSCGTVAAVSGHVGHRVIVYPPLDTSGLTQAKYSCVCDECKASVAPATKRFMCAVCPSYDRCEACSGACDRALKETHRHPYLVLSAPWQVQLVKRSWMHVGLLDCDEESDSSDDDSSDGTNEDSISDFFSP
ncbi:hypothetical protein DIPPA_24519 [Diplonema papillatum]|nr:hypothetical protein DIPPA_24519 [Diplonema papillatum]